MNIAEAAELILINPLNPDVPIRGMKQFTDKYLYELVDVTRDAIFDTHQELVALEKVQAHAPTAAMAITIKKYMSKKRRYRSKLNTLIRHLHERALPIRRARRLKVVSR